MDDIIFEQEQYKGLEILLAEGYHYNTSNACMSRSIVGCLGWETDVWCPQLKDYKRWFTEYHDYNRRIWYDRTIELVRES